ncbi:MAG: lecithin retinol acyltransferase family protein [Synergistaceae bacterium]|nr:lecithin retinol acyltransferase family protein [Synergistaceae bacterium]
MRELEKFLLPLLSLAEKNILTQREIKPENGDVIRVNRGLYNHYGIYVKDLNHVIHYTGANGPSDFNGIVRETSLNEFLNGAKNFHVCKFPDSPSELQNDSILSRDNNKKNLFNLWQEIKKLRLKNYHLYSGEETIKRARDKLGEGGYNLAFNNCEHFAVWCKTGIKDSSQVNKILDIITYLLS